MATENVLLFNPRSASGKHRIPNSILQVAASINGRYEFVLVDGNMESDPWSVIEEYLSTGQFKFFGSTVMPGPQLKEAIPFSKKIREKYPDITIVWGGYFASNQYKVSLESGFVDYIINGPGDFAFPNLLDALTGKNEQKLEEINNLIFLDKDKNIVRTGKDHLPDMDKLPDLPYDILNDFYPIKNYLGKTFLGERTLSYHSSFGCPFTCSFCAVVPIYNARWKGVSAQKMYNHIRYLKDNFGMDSVEFHDNNFFTSRKRVVEFANLVKDDHLTWWGEGRIDTIDAYSDEDLILMREAGCKMIFLGAETGNDDILKQMDKGGKQSGAQIKSFAERMKRVGIIPEMSFVLGMPGESEEAVMDQIDFDIQFIKEIKEINPDTEIIIYIYSPVPTEGSDLYKQITEAGFHFPEKLEDWLDPVWENFDLRKNPLTPWLTPKMVDKIRNFETVLNGYYPTATDTRIRGFKRKMLRSAAYPRYKLGLYKLPYEIKLMHKIWKYRQPETEGFPKD